MSRSLPAAITNALAAAGAQPSLSVQVQNLQTQFQLLATNSNNHPSITQALVTSAGTLLRFVTLTTGGLYVNRITDPTSVAQWQAAAATVSLNARATAGCAPTQTGSTIRCFYYQNATDQIVYKDSTDDGVTWGAETATHAAPWPLPNLCYGLAAYDINNVFVASAAYSGFDVAAAILYQSTYTGGAWGAWASVGPPSPAWGQIRGITSYYGANLLAGVQMRTLRTGCSVANTYVSTPWSAWSQILSMDNKNLGLTYQYPQASYNGTIVTLAAMLQDDGSASGTAQTRTGVYQAGTDLQFHLVGIIGNTLQVNAAAVVLGGIIYVFDAQTVYAASPPPAAIDVSNDVLALRISEKPDTPQQITLVLANDAGQYNSVASLSPNATVTIALGYNGTTIATHTAYIDTLTRVATAENLTCEISGRSVSKFLEQVISRALIYSNQTIAQLVTAIFKATGLTLDPLPATSQFSQQLPCFMLQPGDTWATALNRLGNVYGFSTLDRATPSVTIVEPQVSDASTWSYGQETLGLAWASHADQSTLIRVIGQSSTSTPAYSDLTDDTGILLSGGERYRHIVDRNLTTSAQARIRAQRALRMEQEASSTGTITVSLNPGHELLDVVTVTDARISLSGQRMRIHGIDWHIDMQTGEWLQHLHTQLP